MLNSRYPFIVAAIVSLGGFLFGFDASVISGVNKYITAQFSLSDLQLGWVVSSPSFSAMFAMLVAGAVSDKLGRRRVLMIVAFLYAVSAIMSALASGYEMLVIARMIGGAAFGSALILAPIYIAEIAPARNRGKMVSINQLNIVVGFSAAYFCNYLFNNILSDPDSSMYMGLTGKTVWRWMLGIETLPAVFYFVTLFFVPRSPRWLLMKGREEEAVSVLQKMNAAEDVDQVLGEIKTSLSADSEKAAGSFKELFSPALRTVMIIALVIGVLQQITGINAIFFYATTIFEKAGFSENASFVQAVWVGIINVVVTVIAMLLIDRVGRKPLMIVGVLGVAISLGVAAYGFHQADYKLSQEQIQTFVDSKSDDASFDSGGLAAMADKSYDELGFKAAIATALGDAADAHQGELVKTAANLNSTLILIGILGFVSSFAISLGPVMWVLLSELFPNRLRGIAISSIGFINSFVSWFVQYIFPWELGNYGSATTFIIYTVFAVIGLVLICILMPETKGKTLETLEAELSQ